jgi:hypothetical protein
VRDDTRCRAAGSTTPNTAVVGETWTVHLRSHSGGLFRNFEEQQAWWKGIHIDTVAASIRGRCGCETKKQTP